MGYDDQSQISRMAEQIADLTERVEILESRARNSLIRDLLEVWAGTCFIFILVAGGMLLISGADSELTREGLAIGRLLIDIRDAAGLGSIMAGLVFAVVFFGRLIKRGYDRIVKRN